MTRLLRLLGILLAATAIWLALPSGAAEAAPAATASSVVLATELAPPDTTTGEEAQTPTPPTPPAQTEGTSDGNITVDVTGLSEKPSTSVTMLIGLTMLSLAPAILLTCTSFTKILVVLGLTRNALGLQQTPPNQVLAGLALFLSLFIMGPVLAEMNAEGVQPYMNGDKGTTEAMQDGGAPLKEFMIEHTNDAELELLTNVADKELPENHADVGWSTLVPAFVLSELKEAFIIGFIVFIPFLVIDIVVSGALMALGMMMMPPVMVSLPFKLLLFVLVDGWALVIKSLVASYG